MTVNSSTNAFNSRKKRQSADYTYWHTFSTIDVNITRTYGEQINLNYYLHV